MGRVGEGEVSLQATWDQGGRDRTTEVEGFQVSKRDRKNWQRGTARGITRDCTITQTANLCMCIMIIV
jgi:hypothetical protein